MGLAAPGLPRQRAPVLLGHLGIPIPNPPPWHPVLAAARHLHQATLRVTLGATQAAAGLVP